MPLPEIDFDCTGRINRRDMPDILAPGEVLMRENFIVVGVGEMKRNKKMPGSIRLNASALTGIPKSGIRYYSGNISKTFVATQDGNTVRIYHISDSGTATVKKTLSVQGNSIPDWEIMKVSGQDVLYFVDGYNGMFSHDGNVGNTFKKETAVTLNFVRIISHLDRLFGFEEDSDTLYGSKNLTPTNFTDSTDAFSIAIGSKRGSKLMSPYLLNETLYLAKEDSWFVLEGRTPSEFQVRQIHGISGTPARFGGANVETAIIYLDQDYEFREFNGVSSKILSYNLAIGGDSSIGLDPNPDLSPIINKQKMENVRAVYHSKLFRCAFTETGQTINKLEYIYNTANQSDALSRNNNVSCYIPWDKKPDNRELYTGRSDLGFVMRQYHGNNWDEGQTGATMIVGIQTGFVRPGKNQNSRMKRCYGNFKVLGAEDLTIDHYVDCRQSTKQQFVLPIDGEKDSMMGFSNNQQTAVTSRAIVPWGKGKGLSHSLGISMERADINLSFSKFTGEFILKNRSRSEKVGV